MKLFVFLTKISRFFTSFDMFVTCIALVAISLIQHFLINNLNHSITNPAIELLTGIQWKLLIIVITLSWFFAITISLALIDFFKYFNIDADDIVFYIAYIIFAFSVIHDLLLLLSVEQFSLLATVISFPLFILFPSSIKQVREFIKKSRIENTRDNSQSDNNK